MNIISKESYPIGLCTTIAMCFLWSRNLTFKITLVLSSWWVQVNWMVVVTWGVWYFVFRNKLGLQNYLRQKRMMMIMMMNDDYVGRVHWTEQRGLRASWENMLLTIDMDRGKTTKPESRIIRRRTKTYATPVFVHNLHVHSPEESCEDENLTWQRDLTSLDLRKGDKSNLVHKSTNITWEDEKLQWMTWVRGRLCRPAPTGSHVNVAPLRLVGFCLYFRSDVQVRHSECSAQSSSSHSIWRNGEWLFVGNSVKPQHRKTGWRLTTRLTLPIQQISSSNWGRKTILPIALWPWGSTQPLTEMSTRRISWG